MILYDYIGGLFSRLRWGFGANFHPFGFLVFEVFCSPFGLVSGAFNDNCLITLLAAISAPSAQFVVGALSGHRMDKQ